MRIRNAAPDDSDALIALNAAVQQLHADAEPGIFRQPKPGVFHPRPVAEILAEPGSTLIIACEGDDALGYAWIRLRDQPETDSTWANRWLLIEHIAVRPDAQRHGIGTALIERARELALEQGIQQLTLASWSFNSKAHRFFAAQGFEPYLISFRAKVGYSALNNS